MQDSPHSLIDHRPEQPPNARRQLVRSGAGSLALKLVGTAISFLLTVFLARGLGPDGYGVYAFVLALVTLLAIPAQAGLPPLVVRETAKAEVQQDWGLMRGLWRWTNRYVVIFSLVMMGAGAVFIWLGESWLSEARRETLILGLLLVPLVALGNIRGASLRGLRHVVLGQVPEAILRPGVLLAIMLLVSLSWPAGQVPPDYAMAAHLAAALLAFTVGAVMLRRLRPAPLAAAPAPRYDAAVWRRASIPLALLAGLYLINGQMDIIMLGALRSDEEVGIYKVVYAIAGLVVFGLQAVNQVVQPRFAGLYSQGKLSELQQLVTYGARVILALALPPVLVMVAFGAPLLDFLFGNEYRAGTMALVILALGQLVNAAMGSVGILLNMTGHERDTVRGVSVAAVCNVVLNAILIPSFGIEGAAVASSITLVIWNLILRRFVRARLNIEPTAFASLARS